MEKTLLVYYSLSAGNTKIISEKIQAALGCDIVRLDTTIPYTGSYDEIVEQGQQEVNKGYQPEIKPLGVDLADYDRVIVGTPTWWYTMAPAVLTFLNSQDWEGKTVVPFQTHGGWPGHTIKDMKSACKGAKFENEKDIQFDSTGGSAMVTKEKELDDWIASLK
jgi:flavodoxin